MKDTRQCPKCGNHDVFVIDGYAGAHGVGNNIQNGMTIFSYIPVDRYVCSKCGYSEEWIRVEDLERARCSKHAKEIDD